jgi:hypothetical protein
MVHQRLVTNMGDVIQFVSRSERERTRLIREARAIYDSIFPPADPLRGQQDKAPAGQAISGSNAHHRDGGRRS